MKAFELFAGAGGLALGTKPAGFTHEVLVEWNEYACATLRRNGWSGVFDQDVRGLDFTPWRERIQLLAAGAPCQPFSLGGKHAGDGDARNMFPQVIKAVR